MTRINQTGRELPTRLNWLDALSRYGRTKVHFVDCIIAATARDQRVSVATFDQDFRKFPDVELR